MLNIRPGTISLRSSLTLSMFLMLTPLVLSAVLGYTILHKTVVYDFVDTTQRQKDILVPLQNLQVTMLQVEIPLEEFLVSGSAEKFDHFRSLRREVESTFSRLMSNLDAEYLPLLQRSMDDWDALEKEVATLLAAHEAGDAQTLAASQSRFDSLQAAAHDKLEAIVDLVEEEINLDYQDATLGLERSEWIAGIAGGISLLFLFVGIYYFTHTILNSVERLIEGAERFADGDRDHKIEIRIPPELHKVAEEFNKMIGIIRVSEDKLADMATHDKLTGLLNRSSFEDAVNEALDRLGRFGEPLALVSVDIDHFKKINDTYGHDAGDVVLRGIAAMLSDSVRNIDKVFRMGGEEFTVLLPASSSSSARMTAERIRKVVEAGEIISNGHALKVTVSLGFVLATEGDENPDVLCKHADMALYRAKESGRNTVIGFDEIP